MQYRVEGGGTWSCGKITSETTSFGGAGKALGRMLMGESLLHRTD